MTDKNSPPTVAPEATNVITGFKKDKPSITPTPSPTVTTKPDTEPIITQPLREFSIGDKASRITPTPSQLTQQTAQQTALPSATEPPSMPGFDYIPGEGYRLSNLAEIKAQNRQFNDAVDALAKYKQGDNYNIVDIANANSPKLDSAALLLFPDLTKKDLENIRGYDDAIALLAPFKEGDQYNIANIALANNPKLESAALILFPDLTKTELASIRNEINEFNSAITALEPFKVGENYNIVDIALSNKPELDSAALKLFPDLAKADLVQIRKEVNAPSAFERIAIWKNLTSNYTPSEILKLSPQQISEMRPKLRITEPQWNSLTVEQKNNLRNNTPQGIKVVSSVDFSTYQDFRNRVIETKGLTPKEADTFMQENFYVGEATYVSPEMYRNFKPEVAEKNLIYPHPELSSDPFTKLGYWIGATAEWLTTGKSPEHPTKDRAIDLPDWWGVRGIPKKAEELFPSAAPMLHPITIAAGAVTGFLIDRTAMMLAMPVIAGGTVLAYGTATGGISQMGAPANIWKGTGGAVVYLNEIAKGMAEWFTSIPDRVASDPYFESGRLVGIFYMKPGTIIKAARTAKSWAIPNYVSSRILTRFPDPSTVKFNLKGLTVNEAATALRKALNEAIFINPGKDVKVMIERPGWKGEQIPVATLHFGGTELQGALKGAILHGTEWDFIKNVGDYFPDFMVNQKGLHVSLQAHPRFAERAAMGLWHDKPAQMIAVLKNPKTGKASAYISDEIISKTTYAAEFGYRALEEQKLVVPTTIMKGSSIKNLGYGTRFTKVNSFMQRLLVKPNIRSPYAMTRMRSAYGKGDIEMPIGPRTLPDIPFETLKLSPALLAEWRLKAIWLAIKDMKSPAKWLGVKKPNRIDAFGTHKYAEMVDRQSWWYANSRNKIELFGDKFDSQGRFTDISLGYPHPDIPGFVRRRTSVLVFNEKGELLICRDRCEPKGWRSVIGGAIHPRGKIQAGGGKGLPGTTIIESAMVQLVDEFGINPKYVRSSTVLPSWLGKANRHSTDGSYVVAMVVNTKAKGFKIDTLKYQESKTNPEIAAVEWWKNQEIKHGSPVLHDMMQAILETGTRDNILRNSGIRGKLTPLDYRNIKISPHTPAQLLNPRFRHMGVKGSWAEALKQINPPKVPKTPTPKVPKVPSPTPKPRPPEPPPIKPTDIKPYDEGKPPYYDYSKNQWAKELENSIKNSEKAEKLYNEKVDELTNRNIKEWIKEYFTKDEWAKVEKEYLRNPEKFERAYSKYLEEYADTYTKAIANKVKKYGYIPPDSTYKAPSLTRTRIPVELARELWTPRLTDAEYKAYQEYWVTDNSYTTPPRVPSPTPYITTTPRTPTVVPRTPTMTPRTPVTPTTPSITPRVPTTPSTPSTPRTPTTPTTPRTPAMPKTPSTTPKTPTTPKVPVVPVTPKTRITTVKTKLEFKGDKAKDRFPMDSFAWKQGFGWWVSMPPYSGTIGKDMIFTRTKPAGVPIGRTPAETVTKLGINVPKGNIVDLGIMDVKIGNKGKSISYKKDRKQRTKQGKVIGMPPGIVGTRGR